VELRWYITYDRYGVNSEAELQYRESEEDDWECVQYVREREEEKD